LRKGWLSFIFNSEEDAIRILGARWFWLMSFKLTNMESMFQPSSRGDEDDPHLGKSSRLPPTDME